VKLAEVRFYFDADILGLGKMVSGLRPDCTYPGDPGAVIHTRRRPPCSVITPATPDTEWIPRVAAEGLLIITRDSRVQLRYRLRQGSGGAGCCAGGGNRAGPAVEGMTG